jgi:hypothetical protein
MKLKVSGFIIVDVSYECTADIPDNYLGREIEFLEDQDMLPEVATLRTNPHVIGLHGQLPTWVLAPGQFKPAIAEVVS